MRVYIPCSIADLPTAMSGLWEPASAYAVTPRLLDLVETDDPDEVAEVARDLAARASVLDHGSPLRVVVVAELTRSEVSDDTDDEPGRVSLEGRVPAKSVACGFVDEDSASDDAAAAAGGDDDAWDRLEERDVLWYDASELAHLGR